MTEKRYPSSLLTSKISRRSALKGAGAAAGLALAPGFVRYAQAASSEPIKIGFQAHRTGIGAAYGHWYEITSNAAVKVINEAGGINGRPLELVVEDDGTDPQRGAEVVGKFATQHKTDVVFGTLFSHVVIGSAPTAGELKIPYYVVSEGHHVASTKLNRYVFQPGITDVKSQVIAMAPWIAANAGKKVTMIFPDFAFGYDHRDYLPPALKAQGAEVIAQIAIPPTESSFTRYFPQIPAETEVIYHVMVGPAVLTFVKELGEFYGSNRPQLFGFMDSLEAVDINSPGLEFLDGSHFWEGSPRYLPGRRQRGPEILPRRRRHRRQWRGGQRSQGHLHRLAHVRLLGDALRHQAGHGSSRLPGPGRPRQAGRGDRGADRLRRKARSIRKATRPSTASCTRPSATRTSPRSRAAS